MLKRVKFHPHLRCCRCFLCTPHFRCQHLPGKCFCYGIPDQIFQLIFLRKPYFPFAWMHIHIQQVRIHRDIHHCQRIPSLREICFIAIQNRLIQPEGLHHSAIQEYLHEIPGSTVHFRLHKITAALVIEVLHIDRNRLFRSFPSPAEIQDFLQISASGSTERFSAI